MSGVFGGVFDCPSPGVIAAKSPLAVKKRIGPVVIVANLDACLDEVGA